METQMQPLSFDVLSVQPKILYFGTPVVLISSLNEDGTSNLAPMSSAWALGNSVMLGLGTDGKTFENLSQRRECVLNFPSADLWQAVERLAALTGREAIPMAKQGRYRFVKDKFRAAGLSPIPSEIVSTPRVAECPLQMEAFVRNIHRFGREADDTAAVEVEIIHIHAHKKIVSDVNHINPRFWQPLIYNFRHYFALGKELGKSFRSET